MMKEQNRDKTINVYEKYINRDTILQFGPFPSRHIIMTIRRDQRRRKVAE